MENLTVQPWYLAVSVILYTFGVFLHFASDMQKSISLSLKPALITTGLWSKIRNPNYLGELFIYTGFSMLAKSWIPFAVLAIFVFTYWIPNMWKKDRSLSNYPDFESYKKRTWMFIPLIY